MAFEAAFIPIAVFAITTVIVAHALLQSYPHAVLGLCNAVTLVRMGLVAFLVGAVAAPDTAPWLVFGVASLAFALDGLDGWFARREGLSSDFGARFDMETDAALAAKLAATKAYRAKPRTRISTPVVPLTISHSASI
ncbi:MAG: CDP-alcohol phosphatidyltransferase family protein, partial [Pseudomonadota bacterium]